MAERPFGVVAAAGAVVCCSATAFVSAVVGGVTLATVSRLVAGALLALAVIAVGLAGLVLERHRATTLPRLSLRPFG
jgi:hypothetical protein